MANIVTGDVKKGIKRMGELALRISRYDSYRLFTLYENVGERKLMNVSGNQKYYLVFKSLKNEIRIPEYDPKGFFEVDKVNGCILFKITKKNAEDILGMKTGGENIFHIIRVYEEKDAFGRVLNVTDEVEVFNGKWGDDAAFNAYSTENKVDFLKNLLAEQTRKFVEKDSEFNDLMTKYTAAVNDNSDLQEEIKRLSAENASLNERLNEYMGSTYDGTLLSTDTKYVVLENTLENVTFTEEEMSNAINSALSKSVVEDGNEDYDDFIKDKS